MNRRRIVAALLVALPLTLASCVSPPPAKTPAHYGLVRAGTKVEAREVAEMLNEMYPKVRELLPGTVDRDVEVWVQDELRLYWWSTPAQGVDALSYTAAGRMHLDREARFLKETLAHELVHLLAGPDWHTLPPVIEEGLAEYVAMDLSPENGQSIRGGRLVQALAGVGGDAWIIRFRRTGRRGVRSLTCGSQDEFLVDPAGVYRGRVDEISPHSPSRSKEGLYGLGFVTAARILDRRGYDALHALCVEAAEAGHATVPPEVLARECGLEGDREAWREDILNGLDQEDTVAIARFLVPYLASTVSTTCRSLYPRFDADEFLRIARPTFRIAGTRFEVELFTDPEFRRELRDSW